MTVCAALIVKNEELTLPRCLASIEGAADELVVVDAGSADRTKEVATSDGARVFDWLIFSSTPSPSTISATSRAP